MTEHTAQLRRLVGTRQAAAREERERARQQARLRQAKNGKKVRDDKEDESVQVRDDVETQQQQATGRPLEDSEEEFVHLTNDFEDIKQSNVVDEDQHEAEAGGALSLIPPMIMSNAGTSYKDPIENWCSSKQQLIVSLITILKNLETIRERGILQILLEMSNVTVRITPELLPNIIGISISTQTGEFHGTLNTDCIKMVPTLLARQQTLPFSDEFVLRDLIFDVEAQVDRVQHPLDVQANNIEPTAQLTLPLIKQPVIIADSRPAQADEAVLAGPENGKCKEEKLVYLTEEDLQNIEFIKKLGKGGNGETCLVRFYEDEMVLKVPKNSSILQPFIDEALVHQYLQGAGGAPLFRGLSLKPLGMVMSYTGIPYAEYLEQSCDTQQQLIDSWILIAQNVQAIHEKEIIHNDIKIDNITVTETPELQFHVIDFGLSTRIGEVLNVCGDSRVYWMAPEVLAGKPTLPSSDVFSLGELIYDAMNDLVSDELGNSLKPLYDQATNADPAARCSLPRLIKELQNIADLLTNSVFQEI